MEWPSKAKLAHTQELWYYNPHLVLIVNCKNLYHKSYNYMSQNLYILAFWHSMHKHSQYAQEQP